MRPIITGTPKADHCLQLAMTTDSPSAFVVRAAMHIIAANSPDCDRTIETLRQLSEAYVSGYDVGDQDLI